MRVTLFTLLSPWIACGLAQFIVLPDNHLATIEDRSKTNTTCTIIDIFPDSESPYNLDRIVKTICQTPNHTAPVLGEANFTYILQNDYRQNKRIRNLLETMFFKPHTLTAPELRKKFGHDAMTDIASLLASDNIQDNFNVVSELLSWNGTELAHFYKYKEDKVADAWEAMSYKQIFCNQVDKLELHVCGPVNENRNFGQHKFVATLGKFSPRGSLYKHLNIPPNAVEYNGEVITVESCRFLYTYYECYLPRTQNCTIHNYSNCTHSVQLTTSKVLAKTYGEYTVVAADVESYQTMVNDRVTSHPVYHSKHVVLRLPVGTYAKFNNVKVYGNATGQYDHFAVHHTAHSSNITGNDLDALREEHGDHEEIEHHQSLVDKQEPFPIVFWCILVLVILIAVVAGFATYRRFVPRKEAVDQPIVLYRRDVVQIIEN